MIEDEQQQDVEWARELLRRAETLARPGSWLEEIRRRKDGEELDGD